MEEILDKDFVRISKSSVINLKQIDYLEPALGGFAKVILLNRIAECSYATQRIINVI